jgi:hypothetical protein
MKLCFLRRISEASTFMRQDANEALYSVAKHIPPDAVTALREGVSRNSALVRAVTARLLTITVTMSGADAILSPTANAAFRQLQPSFLKMENEETRYHVQDLVTFLMKERDNYESVFYSEVDSKTSKRHLLCWVP